MATRNFMFDIQMMTAVDPDRNRRVSPLQLIQGDNDFSVTLRDSNAAATVSGNTYRMTIKGTVSGGALAISNDVSPTTNTFTMTMLTDTVGMRDFLDGFDARRGVLEIEDVTGGSLVQTLAQVDVLVIGRFYDGSETAPYTQAQSNMTATTDPTVNDDAGDGYGGWSCWYNVTGKKNWTCTDPTAGAAVWVQIPVLLANYLMLSGGSLTPLTDTQILTLNMFAGQTANPFEVRDSDNNLKASIDDEGEIFARSFDYMSNTSVRIGDHTKAISASVVIGWRAGTNLTTGENSVLIGFQAGDAITTGNGNNAFGRSALGACIGGSNNTAMGYNSLGGLTTGDYNTGVGHLAGLGIVSGDNNCMVGYGTGYSLVSGSENTFIGAGNGFSCISGVKNVFIGRYAGQLTLGSSNLFIGYQAGYSETGSNKLYIANTNTTTPLIYGEFDNNLLRINGQLQANTLSDVENLTLNMFAGQTANPFEVRDSDNNLKASIEADGDMSAPKFRPGAGSYYISAAATGISTNGRLFVGGDYVASAKYISKSALAGNIELGGETKTTDAIPGTVTVCGQSARLAASVNQDGGDLVLAPGAKATGGGDNGKVIIKNAAKDTELFCFSNAGGQAVAHVDLGTQGAGTLAIDLNNAQSQEVTFTASTVTLSIANAAAANSKTINLLIDASGASTVITFPAGWLWQDADPGTPTVSDGDSAILSVQSMGTAIVACYKGLVT